MKRLILSSMLLIATTYTMEKTPVVTTAMPEGKRQSELIFALDAGDKTKIDKFLNANTINTPFGLHGYKGHTPLTLTLLGTFGPSRLSPKYNREETARYLISKGADPAPLNPYLESAAKFGDVEKVKMLLAFGAQDMNGISLKEASETYNHYLSENYDADATARYGQIVELLKQAKRKSQWRPQPSKGIFKELETEEFLTPHKSVRQQKTADISDAARHVYESLQLGNK